MGYDSMLSNISMSVHRPSGRKRWALSASTVPDMVPRCVRPSRRWKSHSTPSTLALSVARWVLHFLNNPSGSSSNVPCRGVTIRLATIRYISRYTTHDMGHDTIQNQLIYYQWKILKHCGMCHQYCYINTVILARNSEFKINKDVHNHPCPKYLLLTNCVCKQNNKTS